jgi:biofilm protein TabA
VEDGSAIGDYWFASLAEAESFCLNRYGICHEDWKLVEDPLPGCQHDWIAPVRVKGRLEGRPQWGKLERLENGSWIVIQP